MTSATAVLSAFGSTYLWATGSGSLDVLKSVTKAPSLVKFVG